MAYKRYIKRGGKTYGPYVYHSKKQDGSVISEYRGKHQKDKAIISLILGLSFLFLLIFISTFGPASGINPFGLIVEDIQNDIETIESENTASIRFVIEITVAEHLDSDREFISDIYEETKELDDIWSETIQDGEYARVTFEQDLTSDNDITIYPRIVSGAPRIEVYEKNRNDLITEFTSINPNEYNKVFLTNLKGEQDTFDLKILDGSLEFDYIFDPIEELTVIACSAAGCNVTSLNINNQDVADMSIEKQVRESVNISASASSPGDTIDNVTLFIRHGGVTGIIDHIQNTCGDETTGPGFAYASNGTIICTCPTPILNSVAYVDDSCTPTGCDWTPEKLDDLAIYMCNDDGGPGDDTLVDFINITVDYTSGDTPPQITIDSPTNTTFATVSIDYNITGNEALTVALASVDGGANMTMTNDSTTHYYNLSGDHPTLSDGGHNITFYANDTTGNLNFSTVFFTVDTVLPQIQFVSPTEANNSQLNRNYTQANVTASDTNLDIITIFLYNSTGLVQQNTSTTSPLFVNFTNLPDETYSLNSTANDTAGNTNQTETRTIILDTANPTINYVSPTENSGVFKSQDFILINVTATDTNLDKIIIRLYNSSNEEINSSTTSTSPNFINFTGLSDGLYFYNSTTNDTVGNENSTTTRNITLDNVNPSLILFEPQNISYNTNSLTINFTVSDTNLDECWYTDDGGATNNTLASCSNTSYTPPQGAVTLRIYANDSSGNLNNTESIVFFVDSVNPLIEYTTGTEANATSKNQEYVFANVSVTEVNFKNITYSLHNGSGVVNTTTYTTLITTINWTSLNNSNVDYFYNVTIYDTANNTNKTETRKITLITADTTPPIITIVSPTNSTFSTGSIDYNITVDESLTNALASVDGLANMTLTNDSQTNYFNLSAQHPTLVDGGHNITFYANDTVGNENFSTVFFTVDTTAPNIEFVSPTEANNSQLGRNYIQANVTASDTNLDTITLSLYNSTGLVQQNTSTTSPLFVNFTNLPDETYSLNSTANDTAGNTNQTETRTIILDTANPTINYVSPTENSGVFKSQDFILINVTATDTNLDKIIIRLYNSSNEEINSSTTSTSPNFINFTGLSDGLYFYNSTTNDTVGNENSTTTRNITLDTTNPSLNTLTESPSDPATYVQGATYEFNATISDTNLDVFLIEFDGTNYTPTNLFGNVYNFTISDLAAGIYNYRWYVNDTANNVNLTSVQTYTINNATGDITLLINGSTSNQTAPYTTQTNASTATQFGIVTLYRNSTNVTGDNNVFVTLGVEHYNYTSVSSGDQNHSSASITRFVTITKASSEVNLTLNVTDGNVTIVQDSFIYLNATTVTGDSGATLKLYNAGTLINQGASPLSNFTQFSSVGIFNITGIYNGSQNYTSSFETWHVNVTQSPDVTNPGVSSLTESPSDPATYSEGATYEFNATVIDNRVIDTVIIDFNGTNYTAVNLTGNIYNLTLTGLSVGTYNYRWYANDTSGNINSTENGSYTINQATPALNLSITPSSTVTYLTETTANGTDCPSQLTCTLYRDNVSVSNPETATLGVGTYNYTFNTTGNANYTSASVSDILTVNQATGVVFTYLNNSRANITINQFEEIYLNSTLDTGAGTIELYNNGTLINQGAAPLSNLTNFTGIGLHNITTIYGGNTNYTSAFETFFVNSLEVDLTPPNVSLVEPQNISYTSIQTQLNYTAVDNQALDTCWYSIDNGATNITITCGNNVTGLDSGQGSSTWKVYANDTSGNENSSSVVFFVDSINPLIDFVSPTETDDSSIGRNYIQVNVTVTDTNLDTIAIRLYNSTSELVQTNTSTTSPFFINYTGLTDSLYFFNSTSNDTVGNENSTATRNVSLVAPTLTIIKPENETYITNESLLLEYVASLEDFVFYNIDNGANTTITGNTTFNTTEGQHTLYLYANNSNGETRKNVTFTVNITKFSIVHNDFSGLSRGLSTAFNQSSHEDLQNLSGIILERINAGKINFNVAINVTDDLNPTDNSVDLDTHINISLNRIELNSTALPNFNKSATLYLSNLTFTTPRILKDGVVCVSTICTQNSYSGGTLSFNVTGFTVYSSEETPVDDTSDDAGGGGGGGGGSSSSVECLNDSSCKVDEACFNYQCIKLFDVKIIDFESPVRLGEFFEFVYLIKGVAEINADVEINFWIEKDGEIITSGLDTIYLGSFEEKTEATKIFLPSTTESGIYTFVVEVDHGSYSARSERTIEITVDKGIAIITLKDVEGVKIYAIIILIILAILITSLIFYLERKKIKLGFVQETRWIKKHKISVLVSALFIVIITLGYFLDLFGPLTQWVKSSFFNYFLKTVLALFVLFIIVFIVKKLKKIKLKVKLIKPKTKSLIERPRRKRRQLGKIFINFIHSFLKSIEEIVILFARFSGKLFRALDKFLRAIKKRTIILFREFKLPEITSPKLDLSGLFKFKRRKRTIEKKKKFKPIKKLELKSVHFPFNRFYKRFKRRGKELDKFLLKLIKRVSERHDILGLSTSQRTEEFWDIGKKSLKKIKKPVKKKIRKRIFFKSIFEKLTRQLGSLASKREKELVKERRDITKKGGKAVEQIHRDVFYLLNKLFGKKSHKAIFQDFERTLVRTGKFTKQHLKTLRDIINAHIEFKKTKSNLYHNISEIENEAEILISDLIDYLQKSNKKENKRIKEEVDQYMKAPATIKQLYRKTFRNFKGYITVSVDSIKKLFIGDTKEQETKKTDLDEILKKRETYKPQLPELESYEEAKEKLIDEVEEEIEESEESEEQEKLDDGSEEKGNYGF